MTTTTDITKVTLLGIRAFHKAYNRKLDLPRDEKRFREVCQQVAKELGIQQKPFKEIEPKRTVWQKIVDWVNEH